MTDNDITSALRNLTESVTEHRVAIGGQVATLTANVGTLQTSHEANAKTLDEVLRLELSCAARAGFGGAMERLTQLEENGKLRVESELQAARDENTGHQDVSREGIEKIAPSRRWSDTPGTVVRTLALKALPYVLIAGVLLGAYLVSGGDAEATARALRAVTDAVARVDSKLGQVEKKVDAVVADTDTTVGMAR